MPSELEKPQKPNEESDEKKLCVNCMLPNDKDIHFCAQCGGPMTSYAATGPLEHLFAEGHVFRQAAERPRKFIVVLGIWIIFGMMAVAGTELFVHRRETGLQNVIGGMFLVVISVVVIWKTTRSYAVRPRIDERRPAG